MAGADEVLLHVMTRSEWSATTEAVTPSDGEQFIHCCTPGQLVGVLSRYFSGVADLVVLEVDAAAVTDEIVWEDSTGSGEQFPHIYGVIPLGAVVGTRGL